MKELIIGVLCTVIGWIINQAFNKDQKKGFAKKALVFIIYLISSLYYFAIIILGFIIILQFLSEYPNWTVRNWGLYLLILIVIKSLFGDTLKNTLTTTNQKE